MRWERYEGGESCVVLQNLEFYYYNGDPLKDLNRIVMSSGLYFRKNTLTVLWRIGCQRQGSMFGRYSVVQARDDKSDEKCSYSKDILKEGPAEFAMHWMQGCGQNRPELANSHPQAKSTPPSAFVYSFYGTQSCLQLYYCLWLLSSYSSRAEYL